MVGYACKVQIAKEAKSPPGRILSLRPPDNDGLPFLRHTHTHFWQKKEVRQRADVIVYIYIMSVYNCKYTKNTRISRFKMHVPPHEGSQVNGSFYPLLNKRLSLH